MGYAPCDHGALVRTAVISDIHSNRQALEAVLAAIDARECGTIWCLGDVVGYGAAPNECIELVSGRCDVILVGNHDLAVLGAIDGSTFSPTAAAAVEWTKEVISPAGVELLAGLEPSAARDGIEMHHASPRDPVWEYVLGPEQAAECIAMQSERVCLVGHSHLALFFTLPDPTPEQEAMRRATARVARGAGATDGTTVELASARWLINPGSVGQPRDGDPRAAWLELDTEAMTAAYHRVAYDIDAAAAEITATVTLPEQLGRRLYVGQ